MIPFIILLSIIGLIFGLLKNYDDLVGNSTIILIIFSSMCTISYVLHTNDVGTIRSQHYKIKVYEERVELLKSSINNIIPMGGNSSVLLNTDSPISGVTKELSIAIKELSIVKSIKSIALISIEKRKAGLFWFIPKMYGDIY